MPAQSTGCTGRQAGRTQSLAANLRAAPGGASAREYGMVAFVPPSSCCGKPAALGGAASGTGGQRRPLRPAGEGGASSGQLITL
ncbi:unnamed protein product [Urochloa humidicola]